MIKDTGKTLPRIDPIKIAKALGAGVIISGQKQTKNGRHYMEITSMTKNNRQTKRRIYELDENSTKKYTLLGTAKGMNFGHCVYLAMKYAKDFQKRVCRYCVGASNSPGCSLKVSFYAKK